MISSQRLAVLDILIKFSDNYTQEGIKDVLDLAHVENAIKVSDNEYLVSVDPYDYSKLSNLHTVETTLLSRPLDYGY